MGDQGLKPDWTRDPPWWTRDKACAERQVTCMVCCVGQRSCVGQDLKACLYPQYPEAYKGSIRGLEMLLQA
jgi:hypothetical protein